MPHNVNVKYNGASISVNSIYDQVDLRVQASTADHQGRRREDFSLEIGSSRLNEQVHASGSRYIQPGENLPSEDEPRRRARNSRMRGIQQQPPPFDEYEIGRQYEATGHRSSDRSHPSLREAARAAAARVMPNSHRSEASEDSYYWPESMSTSRSGTSTGYRYAVPAHESTHDMRGDRVQYAPDYSTTTDGLGSGRIQRPGASESFRHQASQPSHYSPAISATSSTSRHKVPRNSYHSVDSSSYSVSSSDSDGTVVAVSARSSASSSAGYHGREMILYGTGHPGPPSSDSDSLCSHQLVDVCEDYQGSLRCSESTCESYCDDDGGGVYLQRDGRVSPEASYSYSDSGDDNEWSDARILGVDSRSGRSRQYYR